MFFKFANPTYLNLLFLIPVLIFFHFYSIKNVRGKSLEFANFEAIARVKGIDLYSKNLLVLLLNIAMVVSLVFSLSGLDLYKDLDVSSFSFVIAIDSSESMGATDMAPNRLSAAKQTSIDFINSLPPSTRIGVMSFSGNSFIEQDMTDNKQQLRTAIDGIDLTNYGGTDIFEAVSTASYMLREDKDKAMILLSDGQINVGNMDEVVDNAVKFNLMIHTYAIGTKEGGTTSFGLSKVDEDSLRSLSYSTGGSFFNIDSKEKMKEGFDKIALVTRKIAPMDLSLYLIILTIILFIIKQFLIDVLQVTF